MPLPVTTSATRQEIAGPSVTISSTSSGTSVTVNLNLHSAHIGSQDTPAQLHRTVMNPSSKANGNKDTGFMVKKRSANEQEATDARQSKKIKVDRDGARERDPLPLLPPASASEEYANDDDKDRKKKKRKRQRKRKSSVAVAMPFSENTNVDNYKFEDDLRDNLKEKDKASDSSAGNLPIQAMPVSIQLSGNLEREHVDLPPINGTRIHHGLDDLYSVLGKGDDSVPTHAQLKEKKKKGKEKDGEQSVQRVSPPPSNPMQPIASGSGASTSAVMIESDLASQAVEIARLKEQLAAQSILLKKHQSHLVHHQQALTCEICLDLMHRPYTLSPCGHITCYGCLIRWFTAPPAGAMDNNNDNAGQGGAEQQGDNFDHLLDSHRAKTGVFLRRSKQCPVCRAKVHERPIEMWGIKGMVANLVKSSLIDLPALAGATADEGNNNKDPWRNVFREVRQGNLQGMGYGGPEFDAWLDEEDGGVWRCTHCYHEIWDGVCTGCHRHYGHDDDDDDDEDIDLNEHYLNMLHGDVTDSDDEDEVEIVNSDEDDDDDDGVDGEYLIGGAPFGMPLLNPEERAIFEAHMPQYIPHHDPGGAYIEEIDDEEIDDDEEDYEGSFIDDEPAHARAGDDDDSDDIEIGVRQAARNRRVVGESDNDDDEIQFLGPVRQQHTGVRQRLLASGRRRIHNTDSD